MSIYIKGASYNRFAKTMWKKKANLGIKNNLKHKIIELEETPPKIGYDNP